MTTFEVSVTKAMESAMATACRDVSVALVGELAQEHGFDADSAIKSLGLDRFVTKRPAKGKVAKTPKAKVISPAMPLPYCGYKNKCNCTALRLNHGLYTQCTQRPVKGTSYCKTCQQGVDRSATGKPTYGTIDDRIAVGVLEYKDPKGKLVLPYANVMEKMNISREAVEAEVKKFSELVGTDTIPEEQFTKREMKRGRPKKETSESGDEKKPKGRGRPKKKVVDGADGDLVAALVAAADTSDAESESSVTSSTSSRGRPRVSEEEKQRRAEEKAKVKAEKLAKKAAEKKLKDEAKAQEKAQKKAEKEAEKKAKAEEKAAADAEKEAQKKAKAEEKAQKEAAAAEAKAKREAAEAEKRASLVKEFETLKAEASADVTAPEKIGELRSAIADLKRQIKAQKKAAKSPKSEPTAPADEAEKALSELEEEDIEEEVNVSVKKFSHNGVEYLKSSDGILYNPTTQEEVGVWSDALQTITPIEDEEDEEEEEDSEEEEDEEESEDEDSEEEDDVVCA